MYSVNNLLTVSKPLLILLVFPFAHDDVDTALSIIFSNDTPVNLHSRVVILYRSPSNRLTMCSLLLTNKVGVALHLHSVYNRYETVTMKNGYYTDDQLRQKEAFEKLFFKNTDKTYNNFTL